MNLYNGDCLEVMKDLDDDSVDMVFCDLPYGQTSCKWDTLIDLDKFWKLLNKKCKKECPMIFTCSTKFGVSLINSNPKNFRYDLVWAKSRCCNFLNAKKMPMKKHEMVYVFYRKVPKVYTENIAKYHTHKFLKQDKEKNTIIKRDESKSLYGSEKNKVLFKDKDGKIRNSEPRYEPPLPVSVVKEYNVDYKNTQSKNIYNNKNILEPKNRKNGESIYDPPLPHTMLDIKSEGGKHSTQKPVALMEWLLKYYSREGDVVLDATMGSGSTGVACKNMNRKFIGIELDKDIYDTACQRLEVINKLIN